LQSIAALMLHARRPELLARELVHLLADTDCVTTAAAVSRAADGDRELLAAIGQPAPASPPESATTVITVGTARDRTVEILVEPRDDIESVATLNAVTLPLATAHD